MNSCMLSSLQSLLFSWRLRILFNTMKVYADETGPANTRLPVKAGRRAGHIQNIYLEP